MQERLGAIDAGCVKPVPYGFSIDAATLVRNANAIADYSRALAAAIEPHVLHGRVPVVIGGDCSILLGSTLALRRLGRYGLFFLDGHLDLLSPSTSESKGAAGMDLALVTGRGPDLLSNLGGLKPLVQDSDVVVFGFRDELAGYGDLVAESTRPAFQWVSLVDARRKGAAHAARDAIAHLRSSKIRGLWVHLDVDVLDDALMPAVDSRQPGGLSYQELGAVLDIVLRSGLAVGLEITILDPELDSDGRIIREFAGFLVDTLRNRIVTRGPA